MEPRLIWINLLVKLGVAAAISSSLVRSKDFKSLLFREEREFRQKVYLVLWMAVPIMVGVWIRFSAKSFLAGDLSFETALLLGVIGGVLLSLNLPGLVKWIEHTFHVEFLPADVYYISEVPSDMHWNDVGWIALIAFVFCLFATLYPARRASKTAPAEALSYE